eukprot:5547785-Prymnesium_polylepis.1
MMCASCGRYASSSSIARSSCRSTASSSHMLSRRAGSSRCFHTCSTRRMASPRSRQPLGRGRSPRPQPRGRWPSTSRSIACCSTRDAWLSKSAGPLRFQRLRQRCSDVLAAWPLGAASGDAAAVPASASSSATRPRDMDDVMGRAEDMLSSQLNQLRALASSPRGQPFLMADGRCCRQRRYRATTRAL